MYGMYRGALFCSIRTYSNISDLPPATKEVYLHVSHNNTNNDTNTTTTTTKNSTLTPLQMLKHAPAS